MYLLHLFLIKLGFDNDVAFSSILTFLSVVIGFSVTAMSIIAISDFSDELYKMESKDNNDMTLFHDLIHEYKRAVLLFILGVFLILMYYFLLQDSQWTISIVKYDLHVKSFVKELVWCFLLLSLFVLRDYFRCLLGLLCGQLPTDQEKLKNSCKVSFQYYFCFYPVFRITPVTTPNVLKSISPVISVVWYLWFSGARETILSFLCCASTECSINISMHYKAT